MLQPWLKKTEFTNMSDNWMDKSRNLLVGIDYARYAHTPYPSSDRPCCRIS